MGDFNVFPEKPPPHSSKSTHKRKLSFLTSLKQLDLHDTTNLCHNISPSNPMFTFSSHNSQSRIDFIFISSSLLNSLVHVNNKTTDLYQSDHKLLHLTLFDYIFNHKSRAKLRQQNVTKIIFDYDKTTSDNWTKFGKSTNNHTTSSDFNKLNSSSINNLH